MKTLKKFFVAAYALATIASSAQADVTIHITGSTAYRSAVHNALAHILSSPTAAYVGSNLAGANQAVFKGTISGITGNVYVETVWNGSISGQNALVNNPTTLAWISPSNIPGSGATVIPDGQTGFYTNFGLTAGAGG